MRKYALTAAIILLLLGTSISTKSSAECSIKEIEKELSELKKKIYEKNVFYKYNMVKYFNEQERAKANELAQKFNIDLNDLCNLFYIESRGNPKAYNELSRATGLIQWLPSTANGFNTNIRLISEMSIEEQLKLVEKYLNYWEPKGGYKDFTDLYLAVFHPAALKRNNDQFVIGEMNTKAYEQNKNVDKNKDGVLTVADVKEFIS